MRTKTSVRGQNNVASGNTRHRQVDHRSDDHLYLQIARALKKGIIDGVYPVGSQLPTEIDLCKRFSVSRHTIREALRRLREDHLIASRPRAGTIVIPRRSTDSYAQDVMSINDLVAWAVGKSFIIKSMQMTVIDKKLSTLTGLPVGEKWLVIRGFGLMEGIDVPVCWAEYYIHRDFAAIGRILPRHSGPIFPLIEDMFGQIVEEVHQEIGATLISSVLANDLKVEPGTAGLEARRTYRTSEGRTAQVTVSIHPAFRFRHSMTLRRVRN